MRLSATKMGVTNQNRSLGNQLWDLAGGRPSLDLPFADNKSLVDATTGANLVDFTRASSGTYVSSDGLIKTSPVNLLTYSEQFDQSAWVKVGSLDTNIELAPDGSQTADKLSFVSTKWLIYDNSNSASLPGFPQDYPFTVTNKWERQSTTFTTPSGCTSVRFYPLRSSNNSQWIYQSTSGLTSNTTYTASAYYKLAADNVTVLAWGAQLEEGTTATDYIPTGATISGAPRLDHDPVTGESLGLLIEEASTNLINYSEPDSGTPDLTGTEGEWDFNNLDKNTEIDKVEGPDGVSNSASRMQLASGSQWDLYVRINNLTAGEKCTFSGWVRLGTATNFALHVNNTGAWDSVTDGVYSFEASDGLNTTSFVKISHTFTAPFGGNVNVHIGRHLGTAPAQQTTGTVDVWGLQIERKSFATSTIQTSGSTVTRAADIPTIEGTNFSSWYNQSEGTMFVEVLNMPQSSGDVFEISNGSLTNRRNIRFSNNEDKIKRTIVGQGKVSQQTSATSYNSSLVSFKAAATDNFKFFVDGVSGTSSSDTSALPTSMTQMSIGYRDSSSSDYLNGHIARLSYWPARLPDSTLQTITQ